jgi:hypothetical protein
MKAAKKKAAPKRTRHRAIRLPLEVAERMPFPCHGAPRLPAVAVISYNVELKADGAFIGDKASKTAFFERIDAWRAIARKSGKDPFGKVATRELSKKSLGRILSRGKSDAAGIVHSALEDFANALVDVIKRFRADSWGGISRIAIGGGFRSSRLGELAIGRAQSLLAENSLAIVLQPIRHHPDDAGVIGTVHLVPPWILGAYDAALGVDIGGGSIRCGIVGFRFSKAGQVTKARIVESLQWQHRDDEVSRTAVIDELSNMLSRLIKRARKQRIRLAPYIGVGCPGRIELDGRIDRGAQNLPGDWAVPSFHLPNEIAKRVALIDGVRPTVLMHNDAVVQGLSELPRMGAEKAWGILTIGTGLGNAAFRTREPDESPARESTR